NRPDGVRVAGVETAQRRAEESRVPPTHGASGSRGGAAASGPAEVGRCRTAARGCIRATGRGGSGGVRRQRLRTVCGGPGRRARGGAFCGGGGWNVIPTWAAVGRWVRLGVTGCGTASGNSPVCSGPRPPGR